MCVYITTTKHV